MRLFRKKGIWYLIGERYQGAHPSLRVLLKDAERQGEVFNRREKK
jgi:hypothetical protein